MAEKTPTRSGTMKGEPMKDIAARELKGHNILAVERFWDSTFWMIEFTVLRPTAYGEPGDEMRLFLTEDGYQSALQSQQRREIKIKRYAHVIEGHYRELILENIEYDCLKQRYPLYLDDLNEIVELLVETVCAKRKTTRISGADFPHEIVRSRFLKLDSSHIEFVMDCLQKNTTQVHNIKQYLLAVLFNAPTTMNNHYTSLVNHDMHAGGW